MDKKVEVEPGKVFVGGLSWDTTKEGLMKYFSKHGEVTDSVIMIDPNTRKPRGFGFVTFKDPSIVEAVCEMDHTLDNKTIDPKPATSRASVSSYSGRVKKIFIGGVSQTTNEDNIKTYFSQFGTVTDVELKYDKATSRMKGFGFVGFDSEETVEKITHVRFHTINGKSVEAKKAEPRASSAQSSVPSVGNVFNVNAMGPGAQRFSQQTFSTNPAAGYYSNAAGFPQQQSGYANYGYNSNYGQPNSYGGQQQGYQQPQAAYAQQQAYGYEAYSNPRQSQEPVPNYGQEQAANYGTPRANYSTTADQYGQATTAAAGYGYGAPTTPYTANYQDQSTLATGYGRGQAPQRGQFPAYGSR